MNMFDLIREWSDKPMQFGESDCCQFVGAVVQQLTGKNPVAQFEYSSEREAARLIAQYGSLEALVRAHLGEPVPIDDGLILLADQTDGSQILGVKLWGCFAVRTTTGVTDWPLEAARLAWSP